MEILVTDHGQMLSSSGSIVFDRFKPGKISLDQLADDSVEIGAARFRLAPGGVARIQLVSGALTTSCFERLLYLLTDHQITRFVIEDQSRGNLPEFLTDYDDIVARLDSLRLRQPGELPRANYSTTELDLVRLADRGRRIMDTHYRLWKQRRGRLTPALFEELGDQAFIAELTPDGDSMILAWPDDLPPFHDCETRHMIGRPLSNLPDAEFGARATALSFDVAASGKPRLDLVEAACHEADGQGRRARYERLLLPWRQDGKTLVSVSIRLRSHRLVGGKSH